MKNFDYQTPTRLIFGKGVVAEKLQSVMAQFGKRCKHLPPSYIRHHGMMQRAMLQD